MTDETSPFSIPEPTDGERFTDMRVLGEGGSGVVYLACDRAMGQATVALKRVRPGSKDGSGGAIDRFKREVLITRGLVHEGIVQAHEYLPSSSGGTLVMEYVAGGGLDRLLRSSEWYLVPLQERLLILRDVARALSHAHLRGIIHRDIKPQNILLSTTGTAKISDFGVACFAHELPSLAKHEQSIGTPAYMAPEQFMGQAVSAASDVYAFGITAYEILLGRRLVSGDAYLTIALRHLTEEFDVATELGSVPGWLRDVLKCCTEKLPEHRYRSMVEVCEALEPHIEDAAREQLVNLLRAEKSKINHRRWVRRLELAANLLGRAFIAFCTFIVGVTAASQVNDQWCAAVLSQAFRARRASLFFISFPVEWALNTHKIDIDDPKFFFRLIPHMGPHPHSSEKIFGAIAFARVYAGDYQPLVNSMDASGRTAIIAALQQDEVSLAEEILHDQLDLNHADSTGRTAVYEMVQKGLGEWLIGLADKIDLGHRDMHGSSLLHEAVRLGQVDCLRIFLSRAGISPAEVNTVNFEGLTPLHLAVDQVFSEQVIPLLVEAGADLGAQDRSGETPLQRALREGKIAEATSLARRMTAEQMALRDRSGNGVLSVLLSRGMLDKRDLELLRLMILRSPGLVSTRIDGAMPAEIARRRAHWKAAELLDGLDEEILVH